jgi:glycosyltransferase involved in cell wall biosynthesis
MRILNLVHQYVPEKVGGTELYTEAIAHALAGRGHEVGVFHPAHDVTGGVRTRQDGRVTVWAANVGQVSALQRFLAWSADSTLQAAFDDILSRFAPDIVHVQHMMGLPASIAASVQRAGIPYVMTLWDFWWRCANAQLLTNYSEEICDGPSALFLNCAHCAVARAGHRNLLPAVPVVAPLMARRNAALQPIIDAAARLIAPTEFVRRWHVDHGFPAERVMVLPPALAYPAGVPRRAEARPFRAAYIGGLSSQKGVHVLIEAFARLHGAAELWVAGDETADPAYSARLRSLAGPHVRFVGRLNREQVWKTLGEVDVVAVPTLWYETYSFIISEAFIAGLPVLASRLGPIADRVRDRVDGRLLPPGAVAAWRAALQELADSPAALAALRGGVRPPDSLATHSEQLEALFRQVLDPQPGENGSPHDP